MEKQDFLDILHFNDVYVMEESEKAVQIKGKDVYTKGGTARFVTAMKEHGCDKKLVLFSGDLLSPSYLSLFKKGHQFVEVFNALNVRVSCIGNHDVFDFGTRNFLDFIKASHPKGEAKEKKRNTWLMANFKI